MKLNNMGKDKILVQKAILGDKTALTELIKSVENLIYNLSIKILWHPQDAEDASQEVLIRVITNLKSYKGESKFSTWVYRLATNHLLTILQKNKKQLNFVDLSNELEQGISDFSSFEKNDGEQNLLIQEMKIGCTNGMLQCLDFDTRISYILGDVLGFDSNEGSYIQNIKPATFRKRLSRARNKLFTFMNINCGIVKSSNNCHCKKQINHCVNNGKINPKKLLFATDGTDIQLKNKIDSAEKSMCLFNSNPLYKLPENAVMEIRGVLNIVE
jgi:RNA polymerase sigma factor (sigma-70 family)